MKKLFFLISLVSVFALVSCGEKPEAPEVAEVEMEEPVTDVTFLNPQVSIANSTVTYSVTVSSSKGEETLQKRLPILVGYESGNVCYGCGNPMMRTSLTAPTVTMGNQKGYQEDNWSCNTQEYVCKVDTWLSDKIISNMITVIMPENVSVEKYGQRFMFENVNFTLSASQNIENTEYGKYLQKIPMRLDFGDYNYKTEIVSVNELYTD